jgi:TPR repeat protein
MVPWKQARGVDSANEKREVDWGEEARKYGEPRIIPSLTADPDTKPGREVTMNLSDIPNLKDLDETAKRADAARARKDYATAVSLWQHLADDGRADAMFWLGYMYEEGIGFAQSDQQAVAWFRKAATFGSPTGMYCLGWMYQNGRGVARDDAQAAAWFRKAAEYMPLAMANLAWMYENRRGVTKNKAEALVWYRKAAALGDETAKANLKRLGK